jgi:hypothetical protein
MPSFWIQHNGSKLLLVRVVLLKFRSLLRLFICTRICSFQVTEEGKQERHLVVSAGNFTVVWDFDIVKDTKHDCYRYL